MMNLMVCVDLNDGDVLFTDHIGGLTFGETKDVDGCSVEHHGEFFMVFGNDATAIRQVVGGLINDHCYFPICDTVTGAIRFDDHGNAVSE